MKGNDISETKLAILNLFKEDLWKRKKELMQVLPDYGFAVNPGDYEGQSILMYFLRQCNLNNEKLTPELELFIHRTLGAAVVRNFNSFGSLERLIHFLSLWCCLM